MVNRRSKSASFIGAVLKPRPKTEKQIFVEERAKKISALKIKKNKKALEKFLQQEIDRVNLESVGPPPKQKNKKAKKGEIATPMSVNDLNDLKIYFETGKRPDNRKGWVSRSGWSPKKKKKDL
ncbi:MAG: hypothetical protein IPP64_06665 [Bacteroidetes bacterium]|nr:hypothetical protein [Bacteroidota bacterium]